MEPAAIVEQHSALLRAIRVQDDVVAGLWKIIRLDQYPGMLRGIGDRERPDSTAGHIVLLHDASRGHQVMKSSNFPSGLPRNHVREGLHQ